MFMKEIKECHEFLDQADPFFLEAVDVKTDYQLLDMKVRELKMRDIYISRNKDLLEIDKRIKTIDTIIRLRYLKKALDDFEEKERKGEDPSVDGFSVV